MNTSSTKMHDMRKSRFESLDFARVEANTVSVFEKKQTLLNSRKKSNSFPVDRMGKQENPCL